MLYSQSVIHYTFRGSVYADCSSVNRFKQFLIPDQSDYFRREHSIERIDMEIRLYTIDYVPDHGRKFNTNTNRTVIDEVSTSNTIAAYHVWHHLL